MLLRTGPCQQMACNYLKGHASFQVRNISWGPHLPFCALQASNFEPIYGLGTGAGCEGSLAAPGGQMV